MKQGLFVVVEGLDYSGKTTLATALTRHLNENGHNSYHTSCSSVDDNRLYQLIKDNVLQKIPPPDINTQALLFAAALNDLIATVIEPRLEENVTVVCERYTLSNRIYQSGSLLTNYITTALEARLKPDITIVLDINPNVYEKRVNENGIPSELENIDIGRMGHRRQQYIRHVRKHEDIILIDGNISTSEQVNIIMNRLHSL